MLRGSRLALLILLAVACARVEPPTVRPVAGRVVRVGPAGIDLQAQLEVRNPNAFPLAVQTVSGVLEMGSSGEVGSGRCAPDTSIPARGSSVVDAELSVAWTKVESLAPYALSPAPVPYRFHGTASLGGERLNVDVPFELTGEVTRAQLLQAGLRGLGLSAP